MGHAAPNYDQFQAIYESFLYELPLPTDPQKFLLWKFTAMWHVNDTKRHYNGIVY